jgi:c-di-GMP-binding flagellar brake protein YcgR
VRVHLDRRDLERIPAQIPATFHWKDGGQGTGVVRDISVAGCAVETNTAVPLGALIQLQMTPADGPPIDVDVAEVRSRAARRIGVRFARVAPDHAERVRQLVQRLVRAHQT